jgi:hypothetical protein
MRILAFMSDNRPLHTGTPLESAEYYHVVAAINANYCKRHGYDFVYYRPYLDDPKTSVLNNCLDPHDQSPRHASWSKLLSSLLALREPYDYVIYLDSDCIFKDIYRPIQDFLSPYLDKDVLFLNNRPTSETQPCAGFYMCKVSERTSGFISDWYAVSMPEKNTEHPWEQAALDTLYSRYEVGIIDSWMFMEDYGQFIRHICSHDKELRIPYFTDYVRRFDIPYHETLRSIKVIDYSTLSFEKGIHGTSHA